MAQFLRICAGVGMMVSQVSSLEANLTDGHGRSLQQVRSKYRRKEYKKIICPFLSALVREGDLKVQDHYSRSLLERKTIEAGLDPLIAKTHVDGNFENIELMVDGEKVMDIFDMEGNPNEHIFSTGIHDCATEYTDCKHNGGVVKKCKSTTVHKAPRCSPTAKSKDFPNVKNFKRFWRKVTGSRHEKYMNLDQLGKWAAIEDSYKTEASSGADLAHPKIEAFGTVDVNPIGGGTIGGSHQLLIMVFGKHGKIDRAALERISLERKYPKGFKFGQDFWSQHDPFYSNPLHWNTDFAGIRSDVVKKWKDFEYGVVTLEQCRAVCQQTNECVGIKYKNGPVIGRRCFLLSGDCYAEPVERKNFQFYVMHNGHTGESSCADDE